MAAAMMMLAAPAAHAAGTNGDFARVQKVTAGGTTLYGWLGYQSDPYFMPSFGEITSDGYQKMWDDALYTDAEVQVTSGWMKDGVLYTLGDATYWGEVTSTWFSILGLNNGYLVDINEVSRDKGTYILVSYNSQDDHIYGYGTDSQGVFSFISAPADDPGDITIVKTLGDENRNQQCSSICYCPADGYFYGVTISSDFVRIALDGSQEVVYHIDLKNDHYVSGLVYSSTEGLFYWNPLFKDDTSALVTMTTEEGSMITVEEYPLGNEYMFMVTSDEEINPLTPAKPAYVSHDFPQGENYGSITYTMPTEYVDGNPIEGKVIWTTTIDGEDYMAGRCNAGDEVTAEFYDVADGYHVFAIYASVDGIDSQKVTTRLFVGIDSPAAPADVVLTPESVTWQPVTTGASGGYVNPEEISYNVYLNQEFMGTTRETELAIQMPDGGLMLYQATVVAVCLGREGKPGYSNEMPYGTAIPLPVEFAPTRDQWKLMTTQDVNGDGRDWRFNSSEGYLYCVNSKKGSTMDDWVFLPPMVFDNADAYYVVSFLSSLRSEKYTDEHISVYAGTADDASAMVIPVMDTFTPEADFTAYEGLLKVPQEGVYYIGIHCTSGEDQLGVRVKNISVSDEGIRASSPALPENIVATPGKEGALTATVSFTLPATDVAGNPIDSASEVSATVSCLNSVTVSGKPGEAVEAEVETAQGYNVVRITTSDAAGRGLSTTVKTYCGVVAPNVVENLKSEISSDMMSVTLSWDAPSGGVGGGYINPENVSYVVYLMAEGAMGDQWTRYEEIGNLLSYTYSVANGSEQDIVEIGIVAENIAGDCGVINSVSELLGTPYQAPMTETFDNPATGFNYVPWIVYHDDPKCSGVWGRTYMSDVSPEYDSSEVVLMSKTNNASTYSKISMPCFATEANTQITFSIYTGEKAAKLTVLGLTDGMTAPVEIGTTGKGEGGFRDVTFPLPEALRERGWVQIFLQADFETASQIVAINEITVVNDGTGVKMLNADGAKVTAIPGGVLISDAEGLSATVYDLSGKVVAKRNIASPAATVMLAKGVYVVDVDRRRYKLQVR